MITPTQRTVNDVNTQTGPRSPIAQPSSSSQNSLQHWAVGQILKATVVQQLNQNNLLLSIGKQTFSAQLSQQNIANQAKLPLGSQIDLKVIRAGNQPIMQVQVPSVGQQIAQITANGFRQALPKQAPLSELFTQLQNLSQGENRLPPNVQQALISLQSQLVARSALHTPENVKRAMQESGVFLESNLRTDHSNSKSPLDPTHGRDLKAQLLRLSSLLAANSQLSGVSPSKQTPSTPNDLARAQLNAATTAAANSQTTTNIAQALSMDVPALQQHVESALARIQLNQLHSINGPEQTQNGLLIELPVKDKQQIDVFNVRIEEEEGKNQSPGSQRLWSVMLSFEMSGLGAMHTRLTLGGDQVRASLWAENDSTYDLIEANMSALKARLHDVAFVDPQVRCFKGKPEQLISTPEQTDELINIEI